MLKRPLIVLAVALVSPATRAAVIHVPGDQPTIQAGIDAAVSGDEVVVAPGTYAMEELQTVIINSKNITLRSSGGAEMTTIRGGGTFPVIHLGVNTSVVQGFTITEGTWYDHPVIHGGGISIQGGSPTILEGKDWRRILDRLRARFHIGEDAEIAVEMDPRHTTRDYVRTLAAAGVNRASLGVQDFHPEVQAAINRIQPFAVTARVIGWLRRHGIARINMDLMYGLPHQTVDDVRRTVEAILPLAPDRLAVFGYAHVPWMKSHQKMIDEAALPNVDERLQQAEAMAQALTAHGHQRIGLDHFARADDPLSIALRTGRLRRNFQGYTTDRADTLLGFGASAIGSAAGGASGSDPPQATSAKSAENKTVISNLLVIRMLHRDCSNCVGTLRIQRNAFCNNADMNQGQRGYSPQTGSSLRSQDQSTFESQKIWPLGLISGLLSRLPAGMTAILRSGATRGNGLPQFLQKTVLNRSASGTLKLPIRSSSSVHSAASGLRIMLLA